MTSHSHNALDRQLNSVEELPGVLVLDEARRCIRRIFNLAVGAPEATKRLEQTKQRLSSLTRVAKSKSESCTSIAELSASEVAFQVWTDLLPEMSGLTSVRLRIPDTPHYVKRSRAASDIFARVKEVFLEDFRRGDLLYLVAHGSLSTEDRTAFSDPDFLVVYRDHSFSGSRFFQLARRFADANSYLKSIDPLLHHSVFLLSEFDLSAYDESFLPLAQWSLCSRILGPSEIEFGIRPCRFESSRQLFHHASALTNTPSSLYQWKLLLSRVMLLPAIYTQCIHGIYLDKRSAIQAASSLFSAEAKNAIDVATQLRSSWPMVLKTETELREFAHALDAMTTYSVEQLERSIGINIQSDITSLTRGIG